MEKNVQGKNEYETNENCETEICNRIHDNLI